ncbi:MAG TPA: translation initiation factor eIF-2B [bacterium]|jgi:ribose 1,5-bisphosphate isomerase|nr:translation initiation factor eIF-2B [bacterium]HOG38000.1 translation initiation factor eIF-2B [bacterium]
MKNINKIIADIKSVKIQGATSVCKATLDILEALCDKYKNLSIKNFEKSFFSEGSKMTKIRATEPMSRNALKFIEDKYQNRTFDSTKEAAINIKKLIDLFRDLILKTESQTIKNGASLIHKNDKILTHCHSSIVEKILISQKNKQISVYNTEARPLMQGRITSKKLIQNNIKTTMIVDSAASFFLSPHSGNLKMDKVMLGCDAISLDGSAVNKIGSYGISLACKVNQIPFYITGALLKLDSQNTINIEIRHNSEIWENFTSKKLNIINIAFDYIPYEYITGIICEFGVIKPMEVNDYIQKYYPWILERQIKFIKT